MTGNTENNEKIPPLDKVIQAIPEDIAESVESNDPLEQLISQINTRNVPVNSLTRLWALGSMQAKVAVGYLAYAMRSSFSSHLRDFLQPFFRRELPFIRTVYCCFAPDADNLDKETFYSPSGEQGHHLMQVFNIMPAYRVDQTDIKSFSNSSLQVCRTSLKNTGAADRIVYFRGGAVKTETQKVQICRFDFIQEIMEEEAVAINSNRGVSQLFRIPYGMVQVRMHGWLTAQKNNIGLLVITPKDCKPFFQFFSR